MTNPEVPTPKPSAVVMEARECDCDSCKQGGKDLANGDLISSFATVWKRDGITEVRLNDHLVIYAAIDGNSCVDEVAAAVNKEFEKATNDRIAQLAPIAAEKIYERIYGTRREPSHRQLNITSIAAIITSCIERNGKL